MNCMQRHILEGIFWQLWKTSGEQYDKMFLPRAENVWQKSYGGIWTHLPIYTTWQVNSKQMLFIKIADGWIRTPCTLVSEATVLSTVPQPVWPEEYIIYSIFRHLQYCAFAQYHNNWPKLFKILPSTRLTLKEFAKDLKLFGKVAKFCQIWSHWPQPMLSTKKKHYNVILGK